MGTPNQPWSVPALSCVLSRVREALEIPDLDPEVPLAYQGLDSLDMFMVFAEIADIAPWAGADDLAAVMTSDATLRDIWLACVAQAAHQAVEGS